MADYDAIIVGSGHNGLVCALALARRGWRVLLLERSDVIGGGLRTSEVTLPGFKHDLFATNIGHFMASPAVDEFQSDFDRTSLHLIANKFAYASSYAGNRVMRVYCDPARTELELTRYAGADLVGWRKIVALYQRTAEHFLPLHFTQLPSWEMARRIRDLVLSSPLDAARLARIVGQSSGRFANQYFKSIEAKGLFTPWAFHLDFGPNVRGGATFAFISAMSAFSKGLLIAKGGSAEIAKALQQAIEFYGGTIRAGEEVTSIVISNNRAVAVRTSAGHYITASRSIIANVTPRLLFGRLVDPSHLPSKFLRRMETFRHGIGTFVVHLALSQKLAWSAADDLAEFGYVHLNGSPEDIQRTYAQASAGLLPTRPMLIVSQTSHVDRSRAPSGNHVLRFHARAFPNEILGDAAEQIERRSWNEVKEHMADRLISLLAEHAPNVQSAIMGRYIMSPLDLERANPNLIGGDCNGGSHRLDQNFLCRPALGWSHYRTPIKDLYMIGASQWPGGGVNGASGYLVAMQLAARYGTS